MSTPFSALSTPANRKPHVTRAHELASGGQDKDGPLPEVLIVSQSCSLSDTGAMFLVPVSGRGIFTRAARISLNGIPGFIGPAPNERLGMVDVMYSADMTAEGNPDYTGRHLFFDFLRGARIEVSCLSVEGTAYQSGTTLDVMQFARFFVFDAALDPLLAALSGRAFFAGNTIWLNGGSGLITGCGSRNSPSRPSLSVVADFFPMLQDLLLLNRDNSLARHNLTLAIPVALAGEPRALLARAAELAGQRSPEEVNHLNKAEDHVAEILLSSSFRFVDPGPMPVKAHPAGAA